jgi:hypothetical protein
MRPTPAPSSHPALLGGTVVSCPCCRTEIPGGRTNVRDLPLAGHDLWVFATRLPRSHNTSTAEKKTQKNQRQCSRLDQIQPNTLTDALAVSFHLAVMENWQTEFRRARQPRDNKIAAIMYSAGDSPVPPNGCSVRGDRSGSSGTSGRGRRAGADGFPPRMRYCEQRCFRE